MDRQTAWELLCEFTKTEPLRKHALAVEAAMRAYARRYGDDEEKWGIVGLLHDFDYEIHPNADEHPAKGAEILRQRGVDVAAVRKKMKDKGFARNVNRDDILKGADLLGVDLDEHIAFAIEALRPLAQELGIAGSSPQ